MATMTKTIREFAGKEDDDVFIMIKMGRVTAQINQVPNELLLNLMVNSLGGKAKEWIAEAVDTMMSWTLEEFIMKLKTRFPITAMDNKILNRFLDIKRIGSWKQFREVAADATSILNRGMINTKALVDQFIARCPPEIRLALHQLTREVANWSDFLREAEIGINLIFPEIMEAKDLIPESLKINAINFRNKENSPKTKYEWILCGKRNHSTNKFFKILKLKKAGIVRITSQSKKSINTVEETSNEESINFETRYIGNVKNIKNNKENRRNEFYGMMEIENGKEHECLVDTSADCSIIKKKSPKK